MACREGLEGERGRGEDRGREALGRVGKRAGTAPIAHGHYGFITHKDILVVICCREIRLPGGAAGDGRERLCHGNALGRDGRTLSGKVGRICIELRLELGRVHKARRRLGTGCAGCGERRARRRGHRRCRLVRCAGVHGVKVGHELMQVAQILATAVVSLALQHMSWVHAILIAPTKFSSMNMRESGLRAIADAIGGDIDIDASAIL